MAVDFSLKSLLLSQAKHGGWTVSERGTVIYAGERDACLGFMQMHLDIAAQIVQPDKVDLGALVGGAMQDLPPGCLRRERAPPASVDREWDEGAAAAQKATKTDAAKARSMLEAEIGPVVDREALIRKLENCRDGSTEVIAPEEGRVLLDALREQSMRQIAGKDAQCLGDALDLHRMAGQPVGLQVLAEDRIVAWVGDVERDGPHNTPFWSLHRAPVYMKDCRGKDPVEEAAKWLLEEHRAEARRRGDFK